MLCYNCGGRLSEHDFCTSCGADVSVYKKIMYMSNRFYNDGLEKATVRDLSGAIVSLRQSLKFNKNNIEARNLLGLVYFEMGEVVSALEEWVISKNLKPKKNIAEDYIDMVQANQSRLDTINQTIKKYNQALAYCYQDSQDLAIIQLKKVLSYNSQYLRAHQLLALLYINTEEWEKAYRELEKCRRIDANNTTTLRYMREVERVLMPEETGRSAQKGSGRASAKKRASNENVVRYQSGNETIIQPVNVKEPKGVSSLLNLGIGILIGVAIAFFLILPGRIQSAKADINDQLRAVSEQSDVKTATIDELEQELQKLSDANAALEDEISAYQGTDGTLKATEGLMLAVSAYLSAPDDIQAIAAYLEALDAQKGEEDEAQKTEAFTALRDSLVVAVGPKLEEYYYDLGYASYREEDYASAIPNLAKAYEYNNGNGDALYYLGESYYRTGDNDNAKKIYVKVIEDFPGTKKANNSETHLAEINNAE